MHQTRVVVVLQCEWLDQYHRQVRTTIGPELLTQGRSDAHAWLLNKTEPLPCPHYRREVTVKTTTSTSTTTTSSSSTSTSTTSNSKQHTTSGTTEYASSAITATYEGREPLSPSHGARLHPASALALTLLMAVTTSLWLW